MATNQKSDKSTAEKKQTSNAMPLFYKNPMPLDAKKHASLSMKKNFGFKFTREVNAVPINMVEMPQICHHYPIAFSPDDNATPVAVLGLRDNENLFVNTKDEWLTGAYIPAYIRRYPFIFSEVPNTETLTLCIDNADDVIGSGKEHKFFDDEGKPTELSKNALEFCKSYHSAAQQTLEFSRALSKSGLLIEREAQINVAGNRVVKFSGFRIIDEKKLADLDDATFIKWRKNGWLPALYAHLFSGSQWQPLVRHLNQRLEKEAA